MEKDKLLEKKEALIKQIQILEWDVNRKQIHLGQKRRLKEMKEQLEEINKKLNEDEQS
jgi:hypothetical protein